MTSFTRYFVARCEREGLSYEEALSLLDRYIEVVMSLDSLLVERAGESRSVSLRHALEEALEIEAQGKGPLLAPAKKRGQSTHCSRSEFLMCWPRRQFS